MPKTYDPIQSHTLVSSQADVTFTSIPATFTDLIIVVQARFDSSFTIRELGLRFNGDSGTNYSSTRMFGEVSTAFSDRLTNFNNMRFGVFPAANATSGVVGNGIFHVQNYTNTTTNKTVIGRTNTSDIQPAATVGLWRSTAAITSIRLAISETQTGNFVSGSTFTLYGIKAA